MVSQPQSTMKGIIIPTAYRPLPGERDSSDSISVAGGHSIDHEDNGEGSSGNGSVANGSDDDESASNGRVHYGLEAEIRMANPGRAYLKLPYESDGKGKRAGDVLFPSSYTFPPRNIWQKSPNQWKEWRCPVDTCGRKSNLGGTTRHWTQRHTGVAFRDNGDGTLTNIGTCDVSMVVEQDPSVIAANATLSAEANASSRPDGQSSTRKRKHTSSGGRGRSKKKTPLNPSRRTRRREDDIEVEIVDDSDDGNFSNDENESSDNEQDDRRRDQSSATPDEQPTPEREWSILVAHFNRKFNAVPSDPEARYTGETIDAYIKVLTEQYNQNGEVFVFPAWIMRDEAPDDLDLTNDQYVLPPHAKECKFLVFPIEHSTCWYGIFVDFRSVPRLPLAIMDPGPQDSHFFNKAVGRITNFLFSKGLVPERPRNYSQITPQHDLAPGGEHGLFLLQALGCFLASPSTFFASIESEDPVVVWAENNETKYSAAHTTHADICTSLRNKQSDKICDEFIDNFLKSNRAATGADPVHQRSLLDNLAKKASPSAIIVNRLPVVDVDEIMTQDSQSQLPHTNSTFALLNDRPGTSIPPSAAQHSETVVTGIGPSASSTRPEPRPLQIESSTQTVNGERYHYNEPGTPRLRHLGLHSGTGGAHFSRAAEAQMEDNEPENSIPFFE